MVLMVTRRLGAPGFVEQVEQLGCETAVRRQRGVLHHQQVAYRIDPGRAVPGDRSQYLPRLRSGAADGAETVGDDPLPYGFESSRTTLETFIRFNVEQSVIPRAVAPEDLFVPETLTLG